MYIQIKKIQEVVFVFIRKINSHLDLILSFWCLNPGVGFSEITELNPRSILLTSGTLAPLKFFETELMTDFPIKLLNKHVIDTKKQVFILHSQ